MVSALFDKTVDICICMFLVHDQDVQETSFTFVLRAWKTEENLLNIWRASQTLELLDLHGCNTKCRVYATAQTREIKPDAFLSEQPVFLKKLQKQFRLCFFKERCARLKPSFQSLCRFGATSAEIRNVGQGQFSQRKRRGVSFPICTPTTDRCQAHPMQCQAQMREPRVQLIAWRGSQGTCHTFFSASVCCAHFVFDKKCLLCLRRMLQER